MYCYAEVLKISTETALWCEFCVFMSVDMVLVLIAKFKAFAVIFVFLKKFFIFFQKVTCILKNVWYNMGIGTKNAVAVKKL